MCPSDDATRRYLNHFIVMSDLWLVVVILPMLSTKSQRLGATTNRKLQLITDNVLLSRTFQMRVKYSNLWLSFGHIKVSSGCLRSQIVTA